MKFSWFRQWQTPAQIHGALFDGAVFLGGWGLLAANPTELPDRWLGGLLLTAVFTQIGGAYLKGRYLPHRLPPLPTGLIARFMQLLLLFHFILFTVMSLMGVALIGWYQSGAPGESWWIGLALGLGGLATWLVYEAGRPLPTAAQLPNSTTEYAADGLLWLSVLITTALMWEGLFTDLGAGQGAGLSVRGIVLALALSALFVAFYLPSRYLFLVEDYRHPSTWLRLWIVMLPLLVGIFQQTP